MRMWTALLCAATWIWMGSPAGADVKVDGMFSDHMVLQRELPVPIWGTATAGETVTVSFRGQTKTAKADEAGKWLVRLDPLSVGTAGELSVAAGNTVTFMDVLVGEVWVGSGQSNMAGGAGGYARNDPVLAKAIADGPYPQLRLYKGGWKIADAAAIKGFSALHFSFGLALHQALDVPVGLMVGAVGGTPSGRWLSPEMAAADTALSAKLEPYGGAAMTVARAKAAEGLKTWAEAAKKAAAEGKKPPRRPRGPITIGDLYARHVRPFVPYGIRGVFWDQGESRTQLPGVDQFTAMHALINGWRQAWGQGDFYFLHVQKPSGGGCAWDPENPVNRLAVKPGPVPAQHVGDPQTLAYPLNHIKIATIKNAPIVTAVDLAPGIHPPTKSSYGKRACRVALGAVYGRDIAICGPTYKFHKVEGHSIRVQFDHVGQGLAFRHADSLRGFEVAGADGQWAWATARIDGDCVVVASDSVPEPVSVRYAFSPKPSFANLFNQDGLPALMFTTAGE